MRYYIIYFLLIVLSQLVVLKANGNELEDKIKIMANELEQKYPGRIKVKVAILQFRTSNNELTRFNQHLQDQFYNIYQSSNRFEVIDQITVNRLLENTNWTLENSSSFENYNDLSEQIFRNLGVIPDAFIYGLIEDLVEDVIITSFILPNGIKSNSKSSTIKLPSNEQTDQLLGKEVRPHSGFLLIESNHLPYSLLHKYTTLIACLPNIKKEENS